MPPKRKRAEESPSEIAPRATRASTRSRSSTKKDTSVTNVERYKQEEPAPVAKKTRTRKAPASSAASNNRTSKIQPSETQSENPSQPQSPNVAAKPKVTKPAKSDPYSASRAVALFSTYADPDDLDVIGPEGFERLCSDVEVSLEGSLPLILAWQMGASEMAKLNKSEWEKTTSELQISDLQVLSTCLHDLEDLLLLNKPPACSSTQNKKKSTSAPSLAPYNRARYSSYSEDINKAFNELYSFCFSLAKPPSSRNIDIETACALWSVLLAPRYPMMVEILTYINEKGTYKGVNKDMWNMTLEFCRTVNPNLSNYEEDGAWPSMLDNFVEWKNAKSSGESIPSIEAA